MKSKQFLACLGLLFAGTGLVHSQGGLSLPSSGEEAAFRSTVNCCKPRRPILSSIGKAMLMPVRAASGQLLPPATIGDPVPTKDEVTKMVLDGGYAPAEITAAKIKLDEAQGKSRRAAVKYLGTIDCHYYPEAEAGLIAALRADRVEMVRYEAAMAMGTCRGLTEKMLEALNLTALGLELDGNPAETSERVRAAARLSLHRNLARGLCLPPVGDLALGGVDWLSSDPFAIRQMGHVTPQYLPIAPPATQREREVAESVSTTARPAPAAKSFWQNWFGPSVTPRTSQVADPRLRGLAPIGPDSFLAIPASPH